MIVSSCSEEEIEVTAEQSESISYPKVAQLASDNTLQVRMNVAKNLSIMLQSEESILEEIEQLSRTNYDAGHSDYEHFLSVVPDTKLKSNGPKGILDKIANAGGNISEADYCVAPGLAVLLVGNKDSKEFDKRIYVDDGFDDSNENTLIYYYLNGKLGAHAIKHEPTKKALVVRISETYVDPLGDQYKYYTDGATDWERLIYVGKTKCGQEVYNIRQTPIDITTVNSKQHINKSGAGPCPRDCQNLTENLKRFRTTNDYESIFKGTGEFYWYIIFANNVNYTIVNGLPVINGNPMGYQYTGQFTGVKENITYFPHYSSINWNLTNDGNRMRYAAWESDSGFNANVTLGINADSLLGVPINFTITFPISDNDDQIGDATADYCHAIDPIGLNTNINPPGFQYNYGAVSMWLNER